MQSVAAEGGGLHRGVEVGQNAIGTRHFVSRVTAGLGWYWMVGKAAP